MIFYAILAENADEKRQDTANYWLRSGSFDGYIPKAQFPLKAPRS